MRGRYACYHSYTEYEPANSASRPVLLLGFSRQRALLSSFLLLYNKKTRANRHKRVLNLIASVNNTDHVLLLLLIIHFI